MKAPLFIILAGLLTGGGLAWLTPAGRMFAPEESGTNAPSTGVQDLGSVAGKSAKHAGEALVSLETLREMVDLNDEDASAARLFRVLEKLTPAAITALVHEALQLSNPDRTLKFVTSELRDWWERIGPLAAARYSLTKDPWPRGLDVLAEHDPEAAERLLTEFPDLHRETLWNCWKDILTGITRRDPLAALGRAKRGRPEAVKRSTWNAEYDISTILEQWAESDPAAAMTHFENWVTESAARHYTLPQILKQLAVRDPVRAFRILVRESLAQDLYDSFSHGREQTLELAVIVQMAYWSDPALVKQEVERMGDPERRMVLQTLLAEAMTLKEPAAAQAYAKGLLEKEGRRGAVAGVAAGMAAQNAAAAAEWYLENAPVEGDENARAEDVRRLTRLYVMESPGAALQWTLKLTELDRRVAAWGLVRTWSGSNLEEARAAVAALPDVASRLEFTGLLAENLAASRPQEALDWARTLQTPEQVEALLKTAAAPRDSHEVSSAPYEDILRSARTAMEDLAKFADGSVPEDRMDAVMMDVGRISYPYSASMEHVEWLNSLPTGAVRDKHLQSQLKVWIRDEAMNASEWIAALPPGGVRDMGAAALVETLAEDDPAAALIWAADIAQPELRAAHLRKTVQELRRLNPDAARSVLENAALAPAERIELLQLLEP